MNSGGPGGYPTRVRRPKAEPTPKQKTPKQSGDGSGGAGGSGGSDPCDLRFDVHLNNPQIPVIRLMQVGSCLDIHFQQGAMNPVIQVLFQGQFAGSIATTTALGQFTQCLTAGVSYKGTVIEFRLPGYVKIRVERGTCP
jgi:hypothetical protein